jgi:hypothetical protein
MTTWLDRLRGQGQGRTRPQSFIAPDGDHVFVLGAEGQHEPAILGDGDFTEIKQLVDLSGWDLVAATLDTVGVAMSVEQPAPGFPDDPDTLWWFNYDIAIHHASNLVDGAFALDDAGDMEFGVETYSPAATACRVIPVGSTTAALQGVNTPQFFPSPTLPQYTIQLWMFFDSDNVPGSWGFHPMLFTCADVPNGGLIFGLSGSSGVHAHSWRFAVTHYNGGAIVGTGFMTPIINTPSFGWHLVTLTYDDSLFVADRLKLYIDADPVPILAVGGMSVTPAAPAAGAPIYVANPKLWGSVDEMRMLSRALTPAEIAASYLATTTMPTPIDYEWAMQIIINGEVYAERVIRADERRRWSDFKAPVRNLSGVCEVGFRLGLRRI